MRPLMGGKGGVRDNIVLVEGERVISDDLEVAQTFNDFFDGQVDSLGISENDLLKDEVGQSKGKVLDAIKMYKSHPSIMKIRENVVVKTPFSFKTISLEEMESELKSIDTSKAYPMMDIPPKRLKDVIDIISEPLLNIWNEEVVGSSTFSHKLKWADMAPIHKKLETVYKENYRGVNVLPIVSKVFERIMDRQINEYIEQYLSKWLCGYRKGYNPQHATLIMVENWKQAKDEGGYAGGVLMDLSKAFDTINHDLLIAKLHAYGFDITSLELIFDYLSDRWQRTKINMSYSTWSEVMRGRPQGSVLGPKFFNIYLNDLFYLFDEISVCNLADDTTPYACDMDLPSLIRRLEQNIPSIIFWFDANFMALNEGKCHFMMVGPTPEMMWIKVGSQVLWESMERELLGIPIDKEMKFNAHLGKICKKAGAKVTALGRLARIVPFKKKRIVMSAFIESQFGYCPLVWMFCSRKMNHKINRIQERALRIVYLDYSTTFIELLKKDGSVTVHHRNIQAVAIEMYKVVNDLGPNIMKTLFKFKDEVRNSRSKDQFVKPKVNTVFMGEGSVRHFGPIVWDEMLPQELKSIDTLEKFKTEVKKWIPNNCNCRLCKEYVAGVGFVNIVGRKREE